ncbi:hypothetical protein GCM10027161_35460 [Microbispora hainanensis]
MVRNLSFTTARLPVPSRVRARPVTRVGGGASRSCRGAPPCFTRYPVPRSMITFGGETRHAVCGKIRAAL